MDAVRGGPGSQCGHVDAMTSSNLPVTQCPRTVISRRRHLLLIRVLSHRTLQNGVQLFGVSSFLSGHDGERYGCSGHFFWW
jgi:hypothetical protein